jgi:hypothetical protein
MFALSSKANIARVAQQGSIASDACLDESWLTWYPPSTLLKLMYILRALDITYLALTNGKSAVSSEA